MPKPSPEEIAARQAEAAARKALKEEQQATVEDTPLFLMVHDTEEYAAHYFPQNEDDNEYVEMLRLQWVCAHRGDAKCPSHEEMHDFLRRGVDKYGNGVKFP